jgi:hypothetical protein
VRLEGLGQLKIAVTSSGNRTRDLPACSIVPQPTTLPHATIYIYIYKIKVWKSISNCCIEGSPYLNYTYVAIKTLYFTVNSVEKFGGLMWPWAEITVCDFVLFPSDFFQTLNSSYQFSLSTHTHTHTLSYARTHSHTPTHTWI